MFNLSKKIFKKMDFVLLFTVMTLVIFGLFVLNSAINPLDEGIKTQVFATIIGFIIILFIWLLDLDFLRKMKWFIYILSVGLLISVMIFGQGGERWGANLWIRIGSFSLQPSEISKFLHILFLSFYIGDNKNVTDTWGFVIKFIILGYFPAFLVIYQQDLGTAMVYIFFTTVMFFVSGISWKKISVLLIIILVLAIILLPFVWKNLEGYVLDRFKDFGDKGRNLETTTHQTDRGLIALGSGQLTGRGYMNGPFSQNSYIPEQHTDFIFPVLVEDFGFIGGAITLILYALMFIRFIKIALEAEDIAYTAFSMGTFAMFFAHIFENIGMTMKLLPVTGIPLPFFSNGGTFQLMNLILIGFILSISMQRKSLDF